MNLQRYILVSLGRILVMIYNSLLKNRIIKAGCDVAGNGGSGFLRSFLYDSKHCQSKETALRLNHFSL
jgi:hypothetical protein